MESINSVTSGAAVRATTVESHLKAVERVIQAMRQRLDEPLTLEDLADVAMISQYHFDRVFRQTIGIPPCQFLGALRMETAKRLLLTTRLSVTDVCFEVGYNSLGTFITRFTRLVGLAPRQLRGLAKKSNLAGLDSLREAKENSISEQAPGFSVEGSIKAPEGFDGPVFVGLFSTPIPQGRPAGCALLTSPGTYRIDRAKEGSYYVLSIGFPWTEFPRACLLADDTQYFVASSEGPVEVRKDQINDAGPLELRLPKLTDPPILVSLPLMLGEFLSGRDRRQSDYAGAYRHIEPSTVLVA